jgi:Ca-activated chloride channel family protein
LDEWFAHGWVLALLLLVPLLVGVGWVRARRQRRALLALSGGHPLAAVSGGRRALARACWLSSFVLVIVGSAGPLGGRDPAAPPALGRDVLVVLDVSRSMLAEDRPPASRLDRARAYLTELADSLQRRGGSRIGLIVFAGRARVLCHLTEDLDHFRYAVGLAHPDRLGPAGRIGTTEEGTAYGTSLREAIDLAVATHDPRFKGFQEILLVSDGDDLAGDWRAGAERALAAGIPVHALGVGDPQTSAFIPTGRSEEPYMLYRGEKVTTRRRDDILEGLTAPTGGIYLAEESRPQPLVWWWQTQVAPRPVREWSADQRPVYRHRYAWFFGLALLLLAAEMVLSDRPPRGRGE